MKDQNKIINAFLDVARPLEIARYQFLINLVSREDVIKELIKFQNDDGGFGHGLEPDYLNPNSTPIQTWFATRIIDELKINKTHDIIIKTLHYLRSSYDHNHSTWALKIPSNNEYLAAPWWLYQDGDQINTSFNPSAALASFMLKYGDKLDHNIAKTIIKKLFDKLDDINYKFERHEIACIHNLFEDMIELNIMIEKKYLNRLKAIILNEVEHDSNKWFTEYVSKPSYFLKHRRSFMHEALKDMLHKELEKIDQAIDINNHFRITWFWGNENIFEPIKKAWQGILALEYFIIIKNMN